MELAERLNAAHLQFMTTLNQAVAGTEMPARAAEAYNNYVALLEDAWNVASVQDAGRAFENYRQIVKDGFTEAGAGPHVETAFTSYLCTVKDAWTHADVSKLDPAEVAAVGQALLITAWLAAGGDLPAENGNRAGDLVEQESGTWGSTSLFASPPAGDPTT